MFRELKQHLMFGKCQSLDFDAQIANMTVSMILYIFLAYYKRCVSYETIGTIFEYFNVDINEKTLIKRIWELFDELLLTIISMLAENGTIEISEFKQSDEYLFIKGLFENSFLIKDTLL
jgi:hypothetical protein